MTDIIQIIDKDGAREIDLGPVNRYMDLILQSFKGKHPLMTTTNPMELFKLASSMTAEQLRFLVSRLECSLRNKVRENRYLCTKSGLKSTCQLRRLVNLADKQGLELWPDSNELRE